MRDTSHHQPKEGRLFWPALFVDEIMPAGRANPDDWIVKDEAGVFWLRSSDDDDPEGGISIEQGEGVHFFYEEDRRAGTLTFDGSKVIGGWDDVPANHNTIWNNDLEVNADNLGDLESQLRQIGAEAGEIDIYSAHHNEPPIWFEFSATFGPPRLIPCDPPAETLATGLDEL